MPQGSIFSSKVSIRPSVYQRSALSCGGMALHTGMTLLSFITRTQSCHTPCLQRERTFALNWYPLEAVTGSFWVVGPKGLLDKPGKRSPNVHRHKSILANRALISEV